MIRKIIQIDQDLCNGCGLCVDACHEGAIGLQDGKAVLLRDDYCDGLGDCLPTCPEGAISFVVREAEAYDEAAVQKNIEASKRCDTTSESSDDTLPCGCPGTMSRSFDKDLGPSETPKPEASTKSQLRQWPVQIKLVPVNAPYFNGSHLLIAADCTAFAYGNFHNDFIKNTVTLIGCPKLDDGDYSEKLTEILKRNDIRKVTVVRMEVPCCGGLQHAVTKALQDSGKMIPWQIVTISADGKILNS